MVEETQNQVDNSTALEKVIKAKLKLSDDAIKEYSDAVKLASKYLPVASGPDDNYIIIPIYIACNLSYPFVIQPSLVNDIVDKIVTEKRMGKVLKELSNTIDSHTANLNQLKATYSKIKHCGQEFEQYVEVYSNNTKTIKILEAEKKRLTAAQYNKHKNKFLPYLDKNEKVVQQEFIEHLINHIQQLDCNQVQNMFSKFMDQDLQKKLRKADRASSAVDGVLFTFLPVGFGIMVCAFLVELYYVSFKTSFSKEWSQSFFECPFGIAFLCGLSIILSGVLLASVPAAYEYYQKPSLLNKLETIKQELDSDYKSPSNPEFNNEEKPESEQQGQVKHIYPNLHQEAPKEDLKELRLSSTTVQNSSEHSTAHVL